MEQPVNPNRNVFAVKNFLKEYLDLRKAEFNLQMQQNSD